LEEIGQFQGGAAYDVMNCGQQSIGSKYGRIFDEFSVVEVEMTTTDVQLTVRDTAFSFVELLGIIGDYFEL